MAFNNNHLKFSIKSHSVIVNIPSQPVNTNLIFFGLTQPGLELTNYYTQGKHANHDISNAVSYLLMSFYSKWNQTWLIFVTLNFENCYPVVLFL
jgi:hypothetical protein